mmetsp:Transcript_72317/g.207490  ORF Transcript_72317/g.207490 Transcript_72317/m.207490 type:complete len:448 (+) Transcript_72317:1-1344(+)
MPARGLALPLLWAGAWLLEPAWGAAVTTAAASAPSTRCRELLAKHVELRNVGHGVEGLEDEAAPELVAAIRSMPLAEAVACADAAVSMTTISPVGAGLGVGKLVEQVARHPECAQELDTKCEAQTRCSQKWYKIAIHALMVVEETVAAQAMWHRAISLNGASTKLTSRIRWPSLEQTPTVFISRLESRKTWDCSLWPFIKRMEEQTPQILEEVLAVASRFNAAYPYLAREGTWQNLFLYRGRDWHSELCAAMPLTCRLLTPELPTKPGVPYATSFNEEVVIFRSEPGASVGAHCGSSNAVVNLHLTLTGAKGTSLKVGSDDFPLENGRALCFQDSFFHAVEHKGDVGASERISIVVRVMHPQLSVEAYAPSKRTDVVADIEAFDRAGDLEREVLRLRSAYRELAAQSAAGRGVIVAVESEALAESDSCRTTGNCAAASSSALHGRAA